MINQEDFKLIYDLLSTSADVNKPEVEKLVKKLSLIIKAYEVKANANTELDNIDKELSELSK